MKIRLSPKSKGAWTLVEMSVAVGLFSMSAVVLATLYTFSTRSFAAMANYAVLDQNNRQAMDQLTYEIRQAREVSDYTSNSITILNGDGMGVTYRFVPQTKQMVRTDSDGNRKVLLNNCNLLSFNLFQRNPINGTFDEYPAATNNWQQTVKVVQLTWKTSRSLPGLLNSENVQTARIVIRKQQNH